MLGRRPTATPAFPSLEAVWLRYNANFKSGGLALISLGELNAL